MYLGDTTNVWLKRRLSGFHAGILKTTLLTKKLSKMLCNAFFFLDKKQQAGVYLVNEPEVKVRAYPADCPQSLMQLGPLPLTLALCCAT